MHTDTSAANGNPVLAASLPEGTTADLLVELFLTAFPINGAQRLPKRLAVLGVTDPADLTPAQLAKFKDDVFSSVKQAGIKDPEAWLAFRAEFNAKAAAAAASKLGSPVEIDDIAAERKAAERHPATLENSPTSTPSPARTVARTIAWGSTKDEVLNRLKTAIEAGESPRIIAEGIACAQEDFHASQREIGRAIGHSATWVNRVLKWRRSGYKQRSPFGPTTRAGRAVQRNYHNNDFRGCAGVERAHDDVTVGSVGHCTPAQSPSLVPVDEDLSSGSTPTEPLPSAEAAKTETNRDEAEATPLAEPDGGCSGNRRPKKKQKLPNATAKAGRQRSPELMRIVLDSLKQCPILWRAARRAGIHRKTLAYWLKRSEAGDDGYEFEWEGVPAKFHEHCEDAIDQAREALEIAALDIAMGPGKYTNQDGQKLILAGDRRRRSKMIRFLLELKRPEQFGKHPKRNLPRSGGVLVVGGPNQKPENSLAENRYAASTKARQWKALLGRVRG